MYGLKITQTDGTSELVTDPNAIAVFFNAPTTVGNLKQPLRINRVHYCHLVATTLTYVNDAVTQYNGANVLYEYGQLTESGAFQVVASNR